MIKILLITHENVASTFIKITNTIYPNNHVSFNFIEVAFNDDSHYYQKKTQEAVNLIKNNTEAHVLVLTDLYGSTPSNIALKLSQSYQLPVLTGLNLAMLLKIVHHANQRDTTPIDATELALIAKEAAQESILYKDLSSKKISDTV